MAFSRLQRTYLIGTTAVSGVALAAVGSQFVRAPWSLATASLVLSVATLYAITGFFSISFETPTRDSPIYLDSSNAAFLIAVLLIGPLQLPLILLTDVLIRWAQKGTRQPLGYLFNANKVITGYTVALALKEALIPYGAQSLLEPGGSLRALALIGGFHAFGFTMDALLVAVGSGTPFWRIAANDLKTEWVMIIPSLVGMIVVMSSGVSAELLPLSLLLLGLAYAALRAVAEWLTMHAALQRSARELETRVAERTTELAASNTRLLQTEQLLRSTVRAIAHDVSAAVRNCVILLADTPPGSTVDAQNVHNGRGHARSSVAGSRAALSGELQLIHDLVDDMLLSAKLREGQLTLQREQIDLGELLAQLAGRYQHLAHREHAILTVDLDEAPPLWINPKLIERAVANLLDNALKYTRGCPTRLIRLATTTSETEVGICISDTGIGIAPEDIDALGTAFFRAAQGARYEGIGLGLNGAQQIVLRHGGELRVESPGPGCGTTVTISLPITSQPDPG